MKALTKTIFTPTNLNHILLNRLRDNDDALVRIIFSSRDLGFRGMHMLAEALRSNTNLRALDLSSNAIGPSGAHFVALILRHQSMLFDGRYAMGGGGVKTLILSDNNLRDPGVRALTQALESSIVECLWIDGNQISVHGLAALAEALRRNIHLKRLHIHHNSFQSFSPLITCIFNKQSLGSVSDSNHTLKHVFLNCGYTHEWKELEAMLKINRMGRVEARRQKLAMYIEENPHLPLELDLNTKLLPRMFAILTLTDNLSAAYHVIHNMPSEMFSSKVSIRKVVEEFMND